MVLVALVAQPFVHIDCGCASFKEEENLLEEAPVPPSDPNPDDGNGNDDAEEAADAAGATEEG